MRQLRLLIRFVNNLSDWVGKTVSIMIFPMIFMLAWEVLMRYGFNSPTFWAHETSQFFNGVYIIVGGAYALRWGAHVHVDILHGRLSLRRRAIVDLFTWTFFFLFIGVLLWKSGISAWNSVLAQEYSVSPWGPPVWPVRLAIPLGALLLLLEGLTKYVKDLYMAITGLELTTSVEEREPR